MTLLDQEPALVPTQAPPPDADASAPTGAEATAPLGREADEASPGLSPAQALRTAAAGALSASSAAWMVGGLFDGVIAPRAIALLGVLVGCALTVLSFRSRRPAVLQWAVFPVAAIVGAVLVAPSASGGTANLPGLVAEAVGSGGLLQTPLPFDPGWRFLLVVLMALVSSAAVGLGCSLAKPRVAVALPIPLALGAAVLQPTGGELLTGATAVILAVASLAVAFGVELRGEGDRLGSGFELRRFLRAAVLLVVLLAALAALARTDVLFPDTDRDQVVPPRRPPVVPLEPDRELFRVAGTDPGPWRVGVLDSYDGAAWLLPPSDRARLQPVGPETLAKGPVPETTVKTVFDVVDLRGAVLPAPASAVRYSGPEAKLDPRVETLVLPARVERGASYTVESLPPPSARDLDASPPAPPALVEEFTAAPPVPGAIAQLLSLAPPKPFQRLQFLRDRLFANVIVAGGGSPIEVAPQRVEQLIGEKDVEATPYEITAAEAMLARWAGLPSRIGFGYYKGDQRAGAVSVRPKHGAAWLEVYFEGRGWLPLVGTPPRAKSSLDASDQRSDPAVTPSEELALLIYVPVQERNLLQLFQVVRYWLGAAVLVAAALGLMYALWPAVCRTVRSRRRRAWAARQGPSAAVIVAYAELRDGLRDLGAGSPGDTPLELARRFVHDDESEDLAWLVTRTLWGDLRRDVRPSDAAEASRMSRSVLRRAVAVRSGFLKVSRLTSRTSLREPWSDEIPNFWPTAPVRRLAGGTRRAVSRRTRSLLRRLRPRAVQPGAASVLLVLVALLSGCAQQAGLEGASAPVSYPDRIVPEEPETLLGYRFQREQDAEGVYAKVGDRALVSEGRVWTVRSGEVVEGSVQVALLRDDLDGREPKVQEQVEKGLGGAFRDEQVGFVTLRTRDLPEQRLYLWFPPERNVMILMVFRKQFTDGPRVARAVLGYVRGVRPELLADLPGAKGKKPTLSEPEQIDPKDAKPCELLTQEEVSAAIGPAEPGAEQPLFEEGGIPYVECHFPLLAGGTFVASVVPELVDDPAAYDEFFEKVNAQQPGTFTRVPGVGSAAYLGAGGQSISVRAGKTPLVFFALDRKVKKDALIKLAKAGAARAGQKK
jgi:hypothetical protein